MTLAASRLQAQRKSLHPKERKSASVAYSGQTVQAKGTGYSEQSASLSPESHGYESQRDSLRPAPAPLQLRGRNQGVSAPDRGPFQKHVTLTFDDGPNPETTPEVLDLLQQYGIKATFFIDGDQVDPASAPTILQRMRDEGHIVGNHTAHHRSQNTHGAQGVRNDLAGIDGYVDQYNEPGTPKYMRFPYGAAGTTQMDAARGEGYTPVGWTVDSGDWCYASGDNGDVGSCTWDGVPDAYEGDMVGNVMRQVDKHQGGIVLFHDIHQYSVDQLEEIILRLQAEGYTFTNLDDPEVYPALNRQAELGERASGTPQ